MKKGCDKEGAADERWLKKHDTKYKKKNSNVSNKSTSFRAGCGVEMAEIKCAMKDYWQKKRRLIHRQLCLYA